MVPIRTKTLIFGALHTCVGGWTRGTQRVRRQARCSCDALTISQVCPSSDKRGATERAFLVSLFGGVTCLRVLLLRLRKCVCPCLLCMTICGH